MTDLSGYIENRLTASPMTASRLLAVDVGNTEMSLGLYAEPDGSGPDAAVPGTPERIVRLPSGESPTADLLHSLLVAHFGTEPLRVAVASVVPHLTEVWEEYAGIYQEGRIRVLHATAIPGIQLLVDRPQEVGADRVVNAWMGYRRHGGSLLVVDMGTATTFDVVDASGNYRGGVIAPGVNLFAESLARRTARLPRVGLKAPDRLLGRNTVDALRSGILRGHAALVEGLVRGLIEEEGPMRVVATGGLMNSVRPTLDTLIDAWDATLTLDGIAALSRVSG